MPLERLSIFAHFSYEDSGRSRRLVATCRTEQDAELIVRACNSHAQLREALEADQTIFFYIGNLATNAWRDPKNIEAVCARIRDYAEERQEKIEAALRAARPQAEEGKGGGKG